MDNIDTSQLQVSTIWLHIKPWLLNNGIKIVLIALVAFVVHFLLVKLIRRVVKIAVVGDGSESAFEEEKREQTLIRVFTWIVHIVIYFVAALMIIKEIGIDITPIIASAGILGVAIGFGSQYLVKDFITGFFLIIENQYRIGDEVEFDKNTRGTVEDITLRITILRDVNGTVHTVPHGDIIRVANFSKSFSNVNLDVGISYDADINKAIRIINDVGQQMAADSVLADKIITAPHFARVNDLADSAVMLKIIGETQPKMQYEVTGALRHRLKEAFDREGIEIPFQQIVVHNSK